MNIPDEIHAQRHTLVQHWVSVGDVMVLIASVVTTVAGVAFVYGGLSQDVAQLRGELEKMRGVQITPLAAQELAAVKSRLLANEEAVRLAREDNLEFRREVRASLERIEAKLDDHDRR